MRAIATDPESPACQDLQDNSSNIMIKNLIATKTGQASISAPPQPGRAGGGVGTAPGMGVSRSAPGTLRHLTLPLI